MNTCPDCGQTYRPEAGHCRAGRYGGCCRSFANVARGEDPHRSGDYSTGRRCMTDAELLAAGWELDGHYWRTPGQARARIARRVHALGPESDGTGPGGPEEGSRPENAPSAEATFPRTD